MLLAGMPVPVLNEVARLRLESISFFLLVFFLTPFAVRWLWNGLAKDFPGDAETRLRLGPRTDHALGADLCRRLDHDLRG